MSLDFSFSSLVNPPLNDNINTGTARFSSADWFRYVQGTRVLIAGVGGIGSWLAFMISRLNPAAMTLIDDDIVESVNTAGQLFRYTEVSLPKVSAVGRLINQYSQYFRVSCYQDRLVADMEVPPIVMCGFDNMAARKDAYTAWKRQLSQTPSERKANSLFLDGRLSAETLQVFCISGDAPYYMKEYEENWLFSDEEAESTVCSYKQTSYCANLIASIMTNLFVNWCTNHCNPIVDRSLPFMTEYVAEQMYLKTEV